MTHSIRLWSDHQKPRFFLPREAYTSAVYKLLSKGSVSITAKSMGYTEAGLDALYSSRTLRVQAAQFEIDIEASGEVDDQTAEAITELLRQAESGERWKLPSVSDPEVEVPEDQMELYKSIMKEDGIYNDI